MIQDKKNKISLIIPCYNEEESLPQLFKILTEFKLIAMKSNSLEFIFVNDGSSDKTADLLPQYFSQNELFHSGVEIKIIHNKQNLNLGGALRVGIRESGGDFVGVIDADGSYDPLLLLKMKEEFISRKVDIVSAGAHHREAKFDKIVPWWRVQISLIAQHFYNIIMLTRIRSYTSMFRLYRGDLIRKCDYKSNDFMAMAEILVRLQLAGAKVLDYPANSRYRRFGVSKAKILSITKAHFAFLFKLLFHRLFGTPL